MAGLGRKQFTQERATVADVQGYLMDQTVMVFASASARATAIPAPSAGMVTYLVSSKRYEGYNGTAWEFLNTTSDRSYQVGAAFATTGAATETGVMIVAWPDQGVPYTVELSGLLQLAADAGTQAKMRVRLDTIDGPQVSQDISRSGALPGGEVFPLPIPAQDTAVYTGAHSLIVTVRRTGGSGNWAIGSSDNLVRALIRRAG